METVPTYEFYRDSYLGKASEEAFNTSLRTAIAKVNYIVWPREVAESTLEAYQMAICAAIDVDHAYGGSGGIGEDITSLHIGSFSISGGSDGSENSYAKDMYQAIMEQLIGTDLIFMGIA